MTLSARLVLAATIAALAGCAATAERNGSANAHFAFFACDPVGLAIHWQQNDVPELREPERRDVEPRVASVPDLASIRGTLDVDPTPIDLPVLLAPQRLPLPGPPSDLPIELPPSRGAPWLPARAADVPTLLAPERPVLPMNPAQTIELAAPSRALELGERSGAIVDDLRACDPALVIASYFCRLPARADVRERARRNP